MAAGALECTKRFRILSEVVTDTQAVSAVQQFLGEHPLPHSSGRPPLTPRALDSSVRRCSFSSSFSGSYWTGGFVLQQQGKYGGGAGLAVSSLQTLVLEPPPSGCPSKLRSLSVPWDSTAQSSLQCWEASVLHVLPYQPPNRACRLPLHSHTLLTTAWAYLSAAPGSDLHGGGGVVL